MKAVVTTPTRSPRSCRWAGWTMPSRSGSAPTPRRSAPLRTSRAEAQARPETWCRDRAGMRIHGTTAQRPVEGFTELEVGCLLPGPKPYDQPTFTRVKVHRDHHVEVARALYSVPEHLIGTHLHARADSELVRFHTGGKLVKTHPRQPPGGRSTDRS